MGRTVSPEMRQQIRELQILMMTSWQTPYLYFLSLLSMKIENFARVIFTKNENLNKKRVNVRFAHKDSKKVIDFCF
ncbi:MAG: hypothetical protein J6R33_02145 [Clostridia bacterium]|nr:hypothetical protein [Clostridia bacterium]